MNSPEKIKERLPVTIIRTAITTTVVAGILTFAHIFPAAGMSKLAVFGTIWLMVFCIVYGGHLFELLFINQIKFVLPPNIILIYVARIIYWFLCAIPLFMLATWVGNSFTGNGMHLGNWWVFGFFYIGLELFMHIIMQLRFKKSFYNGIY